MRHQTNIVQWPPISLLLKSLCLDIYKTVHHQLLEQWFKSYGAICADGIIRKGSLNAKITSEMQLLCQN